MIKIDLCELILNVLKKMKLFFLKHYILLINYIVVKSFFYLTL